MVFLFPRIEKFTASKVKKYSTGEIFSRFFCIPFSIFAAFAFAFRGGFRAWNSLFRPFGICGKAFFSNFAKNKLI